MAQLPCIGLYKPCINLPFGDRAMYFDHGVHKFTINLSNLFRWNDFIKNLLKIMIEILRVWWIICCFKCVPFNVQKIDPTPETNRSRRWVWVSKHIFGHCFMVILIDWCYKYWQQIYHDLPLFGPGMKYVQRYIPFQIVWTPCRWDVPKWTLSRCGHSGRVFQHMVELAIMVVSIWLNSSLPFL